MSAGNIRKNLLGYVPLMHKLFLEGFATGERLQLQKEPARLCAADQIILGSQ